MPADAGESGRYSEHRSGMRILWNEPVEARDGLTLRADVYLPEGTGNYPVILAYGCYAKGIHFPEGYAGQWRAMLHDFPEIATSTSGDYQCWELTDPEQWVPHGYAVVRVDSRGAGWSPGVQELWSQQEIEDYYDAIEWAGSQVWSSGKVGLLGISYYAANQWRVAALQPPHLAAMIPWEGTSDLYREFYYHGGIRCTFLDSWLPRQLGMQYGYGDRGLRNPNSGQPVAGPLTLADEELAANRVDVVRQVRDHPTLDDWHRQAEVDFSRITIPVLSSANWGGQGLHLRGNIEGFTRSASPATFLEVHGLEHWTHFYTDYGLDLQRRFFDHYLKGEENGWHEQPPIQLQVRSIDGFRVRAEFEWPLARTSWTRLYLDASDSSLRSEPGEPSRQTYDPQGDGLTFTTEPFGSDTEVTGPLSARLFISSATSDADMFLVLRLLRPDSTEVVFRGAMDAHTPIAQGWLRASHRAVDTELSTAYRPVHPHEQVEPLVPGTIYELEIEIWPTCIVVPAGYRLALTVGGRDYEYAGEITAESRAFHRYPSKGCGPFLHPFGDDRPPEVYGGTVTVHTGFAHPSSLLLPVVPAE